MTLAGKVIEGNKLGRRMGYPTANIRLEDHDEADNGVYAARVRLDDGRTFGAMVNIGRRPTVAEKGELWLEANIFDFAEDIYGRTIEVELVELIRRECRFGSVEALCEQLEKDKMQTLKILKNKNLNYVFEY